MADESTRMDTNSSTTGDLNVDEILIGLSAMSDNLQATVRGTKELIMSFNKLKKGVDDSERRIRSTTVDLDRLHKGVGDATKIIDKLNKLNEIQNRVMTDFSSSADSTIQSLKELRVDSTSASKAFDEFEAHLEQQGKKLKRYSDRIEQAERGMLELQEQMRKATSDSDRQRIQVDYAKLQQTLEKYSELADSLVRQTNDQASEQSRSMEHLVRVLQRSEDTQRAFRTAQEQRPISGWFSQQLHKGEETAIERQRVLSAFDARIKELSSVVRSTESEIELKKKSAEHEDAVIRDAVDIIKELKVTIATLDAEIQSETDEDKKAILQEQKQRAIANRDAQIKRKTDAEQNKIAHQTAIQDAENAKALAESLKEESEHQKQFVQESQSVWREIGKSFVTTVKDNLFMVASTFYDKQKDAFNQVYSSIENNQNQISRKLKVESGAYDAFFDEIKSRLDTLGLSGSVDFTEIGEEVATMVDSGIRDTDLLTALAESASYLRAEGSALNLADEELLKNLKTLYDTQLRATGSTQEAQQAVSDFVTAIGSAEAMIVRDFGSVTALQGGSLTQMTNTLLETGKLTGFENLQGLTQSQLQIMYASQAMENVGGDASVLQDFIKALQDYTDYSQLSTEQLVLAEQIGLNRETLNEALSSGDIGRYITDWLQLQSNLYSGMDISTLGYVTSAYGNAVSPQRVAYMTDAYSRGLLDISAPTVGDVSETYQSELSRLQRGSYVTATRKQDIENINRMVDVAQEVNDVAYGGEMLNKTVSSIEGLVQNILNVMITQVASSGLGSFAGSAMGSKVGGGTGGVGGGLSGKLANVNIGNVAGYAVGGSMMGYSAVSNIASADSVGSAVEGIFTDPSFYGGLGTTLGTYIGGPVGGAVLGAIMGGASMIGNAIADNINVEDNSLLKVIEPLEDAADALNESAMAQMESANEAKKAQETLNDAQKRMYLINEGLGTSEEIMGLSGEELSQKMDDLIAQREKSANIEALRSSAISSGAVGLASLEGLFEQQKVDYTASDHISARTTQVAEQMLNFSLLANEGAPISGEQAFAQLYGDDVSVSNDVRTALIREYDVLQNRYTKYERENNTFKERWKTVIDDVNKGIYADPMQGYYEKYGVLPDVIMADSANYALGADGMPDLSHNMQYSQWGKYETGIDYIPTDNYPALLHRGETVLNRSVASDYWRNISSMFEALSQVSEDANTVINNIGETGVSDAINNNSDKIISLLQKVVELLTVQNSRTSRETVTPFRGIDSNISRING